MIDHFPILTRFINLYVISVLGLCATVLLVIIVVRRSRQFAATHATYDGMRLVEAPPERLAAEGNKHVHRIFRRHQVISYKEYKAWREKNPFVFTSVINGKGELLGFFDVFPLDDKVGAALKSGDLSESDVSLENILDASRYQNTNYVYIATLAACYRNPLLDVLLTQMLVRFLRDKLPPRPGRVYMIIPYTKEGRNAAIRNGFVCEVTPDLAHRRTEVYCLQSEQAVSTIARLLGSSSIDVLTRTTSGLVAQHSKTGTRVFMNYRRSDDPGSCHALFERLGRYIGEDHLFMDVEGKIKPGEDYSDALKRFVNECSVLLAIIGPRWSEASDAEGNRRLDNPADWVRVEIASALAAGKRVIPVLINDGTMPNENELPMELKALARCQAVRVRLESFGTDTKRLARYLLSNELPNRDLVNHALA